MAATMFENFDRVRRNIDRPVAAVRAGNGSLSSCAKTTLPLAMYVATSVAPAA